MRNKRYTQALFLFILISLVIVGWQEEKNHTPTIQAHRGGAALYPENTIAAMIHAVKLGVPVLELDLHITKDQKVVVSHDAYLNAKKTLRPDGKRIDPQEQMNYRIYQMNYDSLKQYDVGSLPFSEFPNRKNIACHVPLVSDLIDTVERYTKTNNLPPVGYNIEIKSDTSKDGVFSPDYKRFADLVMEVLLKKDLGNRLTIQSFDFRTLNYLYNKYPKLNYSYLVEPNGETFQQSLSHLNFVPHIYSPDYRMVTQKMIKKAHKRKMLIIPWTIDDKNNIKRLQKLGVDAIITNQPDSAMIWLSSKH